MHQHWWAAPVPLHYYWLDAPQFDALHLLTKWFNRWLTSLSILLLLCRLLRLSTTSSSSLFGRFGGRFDNLNIFISKPESASGSNRSSFYSHHDAMQCVFVVKCNANMYQIDWMCSMNYNGYLNRPQRVNFERLRFQVRIRIYGVVDSWRELRGVMEGQ